MQQIQCLKDVEDGLADLLNQSPALKLIADIAGSLPLRLQAPGFAGLSRIIIGQQVSRASAEAIHGRFVQLLESQSPQAFLEAGEEAWIAIGLSRAKQSTLAGLSHAIIDQSLLIDNLASMPADEAIAQLTTLKGIGPWTAEVYLLFCAGHRDIFPAGDLALQEGLRIGFNLPQRPNEKETRQIAAEWSPYKGIAARLFWAYYSAVKEKRDALPV